MRARVDHVSAAVRDLDAFADWLRAEHGLGVERFPGGAHIPLAGRQYVEVHSPEMPGPLGRWIEQLTRSGNCWYGWAVETSDIDGELARLGLGETRFGVDPTQTFTPWSGRFAGVAEMVASKGLLPYLISYDQSPAELDAIFRRKLEVAAHDVDVGPIASVVLRGDRAALDRWLPAPLGEVRVEAGGLGMECSSISIGGTDVRLDMR